MLGRSLLCFVFVLAFVWGVSCAAVFAAEDPVISSPQRSTLALQWTKIDGASVYNVEWDFYGSFEYLLVTHDTFVEFTNAPPGVAINYRVFTRVAGVPVTSQVQTFTLSSVPIDTGAAVESVAPPAVVQLDSSKVFITWAPFNLGASPEYVVEQFIKGDWEPIAAYTAEDGSIYEDRTVSAPVEAGLPHFYRVRRDTVSSPSTVFATTAEDSPDGFTSPFSSVNIQTVSATEATYVNNTITIPLGNVDQFLLGESGGTKGLVRYDLSAVPTLNLCNFLYARLAFDFAGSSLPTISNFDADGSSIRTYGSLTSVWDESTVTAVTAPKATDPSLYLSDTQIVQFTESLGGGQSGDSVVYVPLDRTLATGDDNMASLLNLWRQDFSSNNGLMVTATNSLTARLTLPVPDLEIVSQLDLSERTDSATVLINFDTEGDTDDCVLDSTCNFSGAWMDGIRQLPPNFVPAGAVVTSMTAVLSGGVDSQNIDRLTVSVSGAAIGDVFLSGSELDCGAVPAAVASLSSPVYPPQAGGWPNFDTVATENNEIKVVYEGDICLTGIFLTVEFLSANGDPNCPSPTPTPTVTPSSTRTVTATPTTTVSVSSTSSITPSTTVSRSSTNTATATPTPSPSGTRTPTTTNTATPSTTASASATATQTSSSTVSLSPTASISPGATPSNTPSNTRSSSVTPNPTPSSTTSASRTRTRTATSSQTPSPTGTTSPTSTSTPSSTGTASSTQSASNTPTGTPTGTPTSSVTRTSSSTRTSSASTTAARTPSRTPTPSASSSRSATRTPSRTRTSSPSSSPSRSASNTPSRTASSTGVASPSASPSVTPLSVLPSMKPTTSKTPSAAVVAPSTLPDPSPIAVPSTQVSPAPSASRSPSRTSLPSRTVNSDFICAANPAFCENNEEVEVDLLGDGGGTFVLPDETGSGGAFVAIPPETFPEGSVVVVSIPQNIPETDQELSSTVVDITVFNVRGAEIEPIESVEICLESTSDDADQCLGFLDFSVDPPEWRCEDKCPTKRGRTFCGETTHFTNFALLLGSVGADECASDASEELIFDEAWKDGVLVASVAVGICCCCLVLLVLLVLVPGADRLVYGKEGMRVKNLRSSTSRLVETAMETLSTSEVEELV